MKRFLIVHLVFVIALVGCQRTSELPPVPEDVATVDEQPVINIPLDGPVSQADAEVSGLTWYGDWLILLPQFPSVVDNNIFAIAKTELIAFLDGGMDGSLTPQPIHINAPDIEQLPNYEGFEAIAFVDSNVYITIETDQGSEMAGYLVNGSIEPDLSEIRIDSSDSVVIPAQTSIDNYSEESTFYFNNKVMTIYEANGSNVNESPVIHQFDLQSGDLESISFPNIEYRITDATIVDENGRFWAINTIFPGSIDKLNPAPDPLITQFGIGKTHAGSNSVERLVEFQYTNEGVALTDNAPIQLALPSDGTTRNWEGIARLDDRGFLIVTDKFPGTVLAFVPVP